MAGTLRGSAHNVPVQKQIVVALGFEGFLKEFFFWLFPQTDFWNCVRICQEFVPVPSEPSSSSVFYIIADGKLKSSQCLSVYTLNLITCVSVSVCLLHYFGEGVVQRQKLSRTVIHPRWINNALKCC